MMLRPQNLSEDGIDKNIKALIFFLKSKKFYDADKYIVDNSLNSIDFYKKLFSKFYLVGVEEKSDEFKNLLSYILTMTRTPELTAAIIIYINETISNDSSKLNVLLEKNLLLNLYKDLLPSEQDAFSTMLVNISLSEIQKTHLLEALIKIAIQTYDGILLKKLAISSQFQEKINALPKEQMDKAQFLLSLDKNASRLIHQYMHEFSLKEFGKVTYKGALLTCAAIAARKEYEFNPVIIDGAGGFKEYLMTLRDTPPPHRERFIIADKHWIACDINITADGQVSVLFLDSLGLENIKTFQTSFAIKRLEKIFPGATIYVPNIIKQGAGIGCSVFALDDLRHLFTLERYLESRFNLSGLHGYLAEQKLASKSETKDEVGLENDDEAFVITACKLPLPLIRTMQSKDLFHIIDERPQEEKDVPVNKKKVKLTSEYARMMFFVECKNEKGQLVLRNMRLSDKLHRFEQCNYLFLQNIHDSESITKATALFTIEAFKKRMELKRTLSTEDPNIILKKPHA